MKTFNPSELNKLFTPASDSSGEDNGQVTIIGGSSLFHGAPFLSLKAASRVVDMVFFSSPEESVGRVAENLKSKLAAFIWVPWNEVEKYVEKSDAVLMGPGMMRFSKEPGVEDKEEMSVQKDTAGRETRQITKTLLKKFPDKKWVIDAGSLQIMDAEWIPQKAILTPNKKEYELLFKSRFTISGLEANAKKYNCIIVAKGPETFVSDGHKTVIVKGGNAGLTKGGTGDVLAGLTVSLYAKNDSMLAACSASYLLKRTADELYKKVGTYYNADDLADKIPVTLTERF
jgi:NAD(P)H-hydrate epimerase